jgi:fumarate hydratase subunit alpha
MGDRHPDPFWADVEREALERINETGIGPQGFGGAMTCLDVRIEPHACHIASLPVAVNIECHSHRHAEVIL